MSEVGIFGAGFPMGPGLRALTARRRKEEMSDALTSQQISELTAKYTYGTWRFQKGWQPLHVVDAEGCYFIDAAGKRYLDFSAQMMCVTLGHKNQAVIRAI